MRSRWAAGSGDPPAAPVSCTISLVVRLDLQHHLLSICREHGLAEHRVVLPEPYIPFVPDPWPTRVLIVSEAQNLSRTYEDYVQRLRALSTEDKFLRLYPEVRQRLYPDDGRSNQLGIAPWDDGPLPLAASAIWGQPPSAFAVGNAVLWSATTSTEANANPTEGPREQSVEVWRRFLAVLAPRVVVCVGSVAGASSVAPPRRGDPMRNWLSASPRVLNAFFGSWGQPSEFAGRFPEVERALVPASARSRKDWPAWVAYACHALSATPSELRLRMDS